jgi:very-short-patch-repair endonuclease
MDRKGDKPDARVAELAARQHGVVSTQQLLDVGLTESAIGGRVRRGTLHRLHQGVYAVGHPEPPQRGRWMAAVFAHHPRPASRDRAFLSHRSAAALWELLSPPSGPIDVTIATGSGRKPRRGIRLHRSAAISRGQATRHFGIPVTTPERTIEDLRRFPPRRGGATPAQVRRAIRQADALDLRLGNVQTDRTKSDLERDFLRICRRDRIPAPEVNVKVEGIEVDFLWRERRLVVETDSYRYHRSRPAFERDHSRDLDLRALGFHVVRFSEAQLRDEPRRVVETVRELLG